MKLNENIANLRKKKDIREGYVLSTLNKKAYAGTYPAVDHETVELGTLCKEPDICRDEDAHI